MDQVSSGVRVTGVLPGSSADAGGVLAGDQIVTVAGRRVRSPDDVARLISGTRAGDSVALGISRGGTRVSLSILLGAAPQGGPIQALVGQPAPALRLGSVDGRPPVELYRHQGRVALVYFWSVWCGACRLAAPTIDQWQRDLGARGLSVVAVTDDPAHAVSRSLSRSPVSFSVAHDPDGKAGSAYWVRALPTFFVVDRSGVVAFAAEGWDPTQQRSIEAVIRRLLGSSSP